MCTLPPPDQLPPFCRCSNLSTCRRPHRSFACCAPYAAVPLVCRRWRGLFLAPQRLRQLSIEVDVMRRTRLLPRLRSLCAWLARAAGQVRLLDFDLRFGKPLHGEQGEVEALLAGAVAACGASGLRSLQLWSSPGLSLISWLCAARELRWLELGGVPAEEEEGHGSALTAPLHGLSHLEHLSLSELAVDGS